MKKIYVLFFAVLGFGGSAFAQPTVLGTQLVNGSYVTYDLNSIGLFKQYRLQASSSAAISTRNWEFASGTAGATNYAINWRPYTSGNTLSSNLFIPTSFANGAKYNTGFGGASGLLPVITSGNYYTFNVNINAASDNQMELLETTYNPVTITTVSNTTPATPSNAVLVTCTTSAAPSSGEYVYVRYSIDGYASSALSQFTFTGTTGKALIPCQPGGTVVSYYVMSSNQTAATITADVTTYGQSANDMATLNLNNGGTNYTYTQGSGSTANFDGIYSVPSTCYLTVSAFVTALNAGTVVAPVTCYAIGGSATETATAGGISITKTGTAANPIVFQKFGSGAYTIQASSALTVGSTTDALFKLIGADYITIDGFTLQENGANTVNTPAASNTMTEWGIALLHASGVTTDGCQNNTLQNNTISLNRNYAQTWGIYSNVRHHAGAITTTQDITNNTTAPHNNNKVYGNTISNVNMGIAFIGSGTGGNQDAGNDVGGSSAATGNTISNWGGAAALSNPVSNTGTSYCIFMNHQTSENVSYNTLTSATVSGTAVTFRGIVKDYTATGPTGTFTSTISNNTVTMSSAFTSGTFQNIASAGPGTVGTVTINITNNNIINGSLTGAGTTSTFVGILHSWACATLNISNNLIKGNTSTATGGGFTGIQNSGAVTTAVNITNNQVGNSGGGPITFSVAGPGTTTTAISNSNAAAGASVNITGNTIDGITVVNASTVQGISCSGGAGANATIGTNTFLNTVVNGASAAATITGISNTIALASLSITNNIIRGHTTTATTGGFTGIQNTGAVTGTVDISSNQIGSSSTNAVTFSAATNTNLQAIIVTNSGTAATVGITNNSIVGLAGVSAGGSTYGILANCSAATINMTGNSLGSASRDLVNYSAPSTGSVYAIVNFGGVAATNLNVTGNTIDRITGVSFTASVAGIINTSSTIGGTLNLNNNAIGTTTGTFITTTASSSATIYAMYNSNGATTSTVNMNNNTIDGLFINSTSGNLTTMALNGSNVGTAMMSGNSFGSSGTLINFAAAQPVGGTFRVMDLGSGSSNGSSTITCQNNTVRNIIFSTTSTATSAFPAQWDPKLGIHVT